MLGDKKSLAIGPIYVNPRFNTPVCPSGLMTVTSTEPAEPDGVVAVSRVAELNDTLLADLLPNLTVAPLWKFAPVIVTLVPPAMGPLAGEIALTVGAGLTAMITVSEPLIPSALVTVTVTV